MKFMKTTEETRSTHKSKTNEKCKFQEMETENKIENESEYVICFMR